MDDREKKLKIKELEAIIAKKKTDSDYYKAMQLSYKLLINSVYGSLANKFFVLSNNEVANAITIHGRDIIHTMMYNFEEHFYHVWHNNKEMHKLLGKEYICKVGDKYQSYRVDFVPLGKPKDSLKDLFKDRNLTIDILTEHNFKHDDIEVLYDYDIADFSNVKALDEDSKFEDYDGRPKYMGKNQVVIYGDTDSVFKDTLIDTNNGEYTIEDLYNKNIETGSAGITLKGHESVKCDDLILNWNEKLYYAKVKRIIRHKVTKAKWKLKTKSGKEVIVTNDHSMIVFRDNKKIEVKPSEILKTDKILIVKYNGDKLQ